MGFVCFLQKLFLQMVKFLALCQSFLPCRQFHHFLINGMMYRRMVSFCHNSVDCFLCIFSKGIHLFRHRLLICTAFLTIQSVMKMSSSADQFEHTSWQFEWQHAQDSISFNGFHAAKLRRLLYQHADLAVGIRLRRPVMYSFVNAWECFRLNTIVTVWFKCNLQRVILRYSFTQNISGNAHSLPSCAA